MTEVRATPERLVASLWALDVLADELGDDWPQRASERRVAAHLLAAVGSTIDNIRLVEFAIRLRLIHDLPGRRKSLLPLLSGDLTDERIRHTDLQLEVTTIGMPIGWTAELEKTKDHPNSDVDVRLARNGDVLDVEVCALMQGARTKQGLDENRKIFGMDLHLMAMIHGVRVTGHLSHDPLSYDVDDFQCRTMETILAVEQDGVRRTLDFFGETVLFSIVEDNVEDSFTTPMDVGLDPRRFESMLKEKIDQAKGNGSKWVRIDYMDLSWQLSEWWHLPIAGKAHIINRRVRGAVESGHTLDGVIVSCGALLGQGTFPPEERVLDTGVVGMVRIIEPMRVRQSVFVPLSPEGFDTLSFWTEIYGSEPQWLSWGLAKFGLPTIAEIAPLVSST